MLSAAFILLFSVLTSADLDSTGLKTVGRNGLNVFSEPREDIPLIMRIGHKFRQLASSATNFIRRRLLTKKEKRQEKKQKAECGLELQYRFMLPSCSDLSYGRGKHLNIECDQAFTTQKRWQNGEKDRYAIPCKLYMSKYATEQQKREKYGSCGPQSECSAEWTFVAPKFNDTFPPTFSPTLQPTFLPTLKPTHVPTPAPTDKPTTMPTPVTGWHSHHFCGTFKGLRKLEVSLKFSEVAGADVCEIVCGVQPYKDTMFGYVYSKKVCYCFPQEGSNLKTKGGTYGKVEGDSWAVCGRLKGGSSIKHKYKEKPTMNECKAKCKDFGEHFSVQGKKCYCFKDAKAKPGMVYGLV